MDWSFFDKIFDSSPDIFVFHGCTDPLFVIYLSINRRFIIMFTFLDENVYFSVLFGTEFTFKLGPYAKGYVQGKATGWRRWHPHNLILYLPVLTIYTDCDQVLVDNAELFECVGELGVPNRPNYVISFLLEIVTIAVLAVWEGCFCGH